MTRRLLLATALLGACIVPTAPSVSPAQSSDRFVADCQRGGGWRSRDRFCATKEMTLSALKSLNVDGRDNGGVTVHGSSRGDIRVVAMIQTQASSAADAAAMAKDITVDTNGGTIRASGPRMGREESWSVSYEIWAPKGTDLRITAQNGGIGIDNVDARLDLETVNGGISLEDVDGDVSGTTVNGGVHVRLNGDKWKGRGLDLRTSNGGVNMVIPSNYSAHLETGTVNGGIDIAFPVMIQGSMRNRLTADLGSGGATIRATTTNGGISIRRR